MSNPYRTGPSVEGRCGACGAELAGARACPACGVEVPSVRCDACLTLNRVGEERCAHCGESLHPEPELVSTTLGCPRGCGSLAAVGDLYECVHCGGLFLSNDALSELVRRHETHAGTAIHAPPLAPDRVVYLPCPKCHTRMNRVVFGKSSGVIVDTCKKHGTWFDADELTASLAFVERGGLVAVRKREAARQAEEARRQEHQRAFERSYVAPSRTAADDGVSELLRILLSL